MTDYICIDANFAVRLVNSKSQSDPWIVLWEKWQVADQKIIAPTLFYYEITNAIYRMGKAGQLEEDEVQMALEDVFNLRISLKGNRQLHCKAVELAKQFNLPAAYDAHYLALSEHYQAQFYTGDKRLFNQVQSQFAHIVLVDGIS